MPSPVNKYRLVPKLRFPEFREAGEWEVKQLGCICQPQQWATISSSDLVEVGYPVYGANGFIGYYSEFNHEFEAVAVTCRGSTCGEVSLIPPESYITGNSMCLDGIDAAHNSYHFVYQLLKHRGFRDVISGSAQPQIVGSAIKRMKIVLPRQSEQQKIADCLSSIDERITAEAQKLDTLKTHKKGLMQQLFPAEGETLPKLRFPEFLDAGEWEETVLEKVFQFKQGVQVPVEEQSNTKEAGMVRFIRIVDLTQEGESWRYIHNPGIEHIVSCNELFMIRYGTPGIIAIGYEGVVANNLFRLIWKNKNKFNPIFWFYIFKGLEKYILNLSCSSSMPAISFSLLNKVTVIFPKSSLEQRKIADCLASLDDLITAQTQKLAALKTHKKGLMQQLFPNTPTESTP
jgi:type I restriction enzyme S subunit